MMYGRRVDNLIYLINKKSEVNGISNVKVALPYGSHSTTLQSQLCVYVSLSLLGCHKRPGETAIVRIYKKATYRNTQRVYASSFVSFRSYLFRFSLGIATVSGNETKSDLTKKNGELGCGSEKPR